MKIWWCNQTNSWESNSSLGVICSSVGKSPQKFRSMVYEASVGDIIVHYVSGRGILAVSRVASKPIKCLTGDKRKICLYGEGWAFRTKYHIFEHPIPIKDVILRLYKMDIKDGPAISNKDRGAGVRQAYFMRFNLVGLRLVYRLVGLRLVYRFARDRNWPNYVTEALNKNIRRIR